MTRQRSRARVAEGIRDRWYDGNDERTQLYGRRGSGGTPDPSRYLARWKPPHAKEQSKTFATVGEAQRWLRHQKTAHDNGDWIRPDRARVTVASVRESWWPLWLQGGSSGRRKPKPSSVASYERLWRTLVEPTFGDRAISSIRTAQVSRWAADLTAAGYSGSTIRGGYSVLHLILDHAVHEERLLRNPTQGARLPSKEVSDPRRWLTAAQVADLAAAVINATSRQQPQYAVLVTFLARTGIRFGEAAALRVGDLDLGRVGADGRPSPAAHVRLTAVPIGGKIVEGLPKSGKARTVALPVAMLKDLSLLVTDRPSGAYLFTSPRGQQLRHDTFLKFHWRPAIRAIGLQGLTPHVLRHTFATEALSRGVPLPAVANQLGHANPSITARVYAHLLEDDLSVVGRAMDDAISESHSEPCRNDGQNLKAV